MTSATSSAILLTSLVATVLLGRRLRRHLPEDHLSADSKDAVKLAMGLVATMTAFAKDEMSLGAIRDSNGLQLLPVVSKYRMADPIRLIFD